MRIVRELDEQVWRNFVLKNPHGNIFHSPEMFEVFLRARNHQPTVWAAVRETGEILALFTPVKIFLFNGLLRSFTSRAIAYGSILCVQGAEGEEALARLLQTYSEHSTLDCLYTEMRNLYDLEAIQPVLQDQGFLYEDHLNYLINLDRSPEDILQNIGKRTRKYIRHGLRKQEVIIEEVTDRQKVSVCYRLLKQTYRSARVPLPHESLFEAIFDVLVPYGMARLTLARIDQKYISASIDLLYKDVIYGWYAGTDRDYGAYRPTEMITWDVLRWGAENGYRLYDFGGAGRPDTHSGIREFKAKFNGRLVRFGRNINIHAPLKLKLNKFGYKLLRRFL